MFDTIKQIALIKQEMDAAEKAAYEEKQELLKIELRMHMNKFIKAADAILEGCTKDQLTEFIKADLVHYDDIHNGIIINMNTITWAEHDMPQDVILRIDDAHSAARIMLKMASDNEISLDRYPEDLKLGYDDVRIRCEKPEDQHIVFNYHFSVSGGWKGMHDPKLGIMIP